MRTLGVFLILTGAGASLAVPAPVPEPRTSVDVPAAEEIPLLAWNELSDRPCRWSGRNVRLRLQIESRPADWNPYLTRFGTGQFDAVQGWADEQFPWVHDDFDAPAVRVFVRKGSAAALALDGAPQYARFEITGVVREVFLDLPWIEIVGALPMSEAISEASVIHAARALQLMGNGAWTLARHELDQALSAPLPEAATFELVRLREVCVAADPAGAAHDELAARRLEIAPR